MKKLLALIFLCSALSACAHAEPPAGANRKLSDSLLSSLIRFYRGPLNHLQAVRSGQCPMYPSCSDYSRQALEKHGFAIGAIMMFDRLMRCGRDETHLSPQVLTNGRLRTYDPLEANDFWWYHPTKRRTAAPLQKPPRARGTKAAAPSARRPVHGPPAGSG